MPIRGESKSHLSPSHHRLNARTNLINQQETILRKSGGNIVTRYINLKWTWLLVLIVQTSLGALRGCAHLLQEMRGRR